MIKCSNKWATGEVGKYFRVNGLLKHIQGFPGGSV